jgi:hypothetical protein
MTVQRHNVLPNTLRRIEETANKVAKDYTNIHLMARGSQTFIDQNLRGTIRFARRRGNFLPVIEAENQSELSVAVVPPTDQITLSRIIPGFEVPDAVLSVGPGREIVRVSDIDMTTGEIVLADELLGVHDAGTGVDLYGVPIEVIGTHTSGDMVIRLRSEWRVFTGDRIAIDTTPGLLNSIVETEITNTVYLGEGVDGRHQYQVTLEEGISRSLANEEDILLRAQPGYQSTALRVSRINGPFVVDFVSGPFFEKTTIDEFLSIQLFNALGDTITGYSEPVLVGKNFGVFDMPIKAESMLFWDVAHGSIQWRNGKLIAITDSNGRFLLYTDLVPAFTSGVEWEIPVKSNDTTSLSVRFYPNESRSFSLATGILTRIRVGTTTSDEDASRIEISVRTENPGSEVEFNNWLPTSSAVSTLLYQLTSTAFGSNLWQAGSLMLKEYFFTLDDISARYDFVSYDNGTIQL